MKKLTTNVLVLVLSSSFAVAFAQKKTKDSMRTTDIGEVIITGALGIKKKADAVVSAQQVVGAKELTVAAPPDAIQGLQAKVSGLNISQTNSSVNPTNRIVLRGVKLSVRGNIGSSKTGYPVLRQSTHASSGAWYMVIHFCSIIRFKEVL